MAEEQKKRENEFTSCCQGMPLTEMIRKIMEKKTTGSPFDCAEMLSRMTRVCCGFPTKEEIPTEDPKEKEKI